MWVMVRVTLAFMRKAHAARICSAAVRVALSDDAQPHRNASAIPSSEFNLGLAGMKLLRSAPDSYRRLLRQDHPGC